MYVEDYAYSLDKSLHFVYFYVSEYFLSVIGFFDGVIKTCRNCLSWLIQLVIFNGVMYDQGISQGLRLGV